MGLARIHHLALSQNSREGYIDYKRREKSSAGFVCSDELFIIYAPIIPYNMSYIEVLFWEIQNGKMESV